MDLLYSLEVMIVGFTVVVASLYLLYLVLVVFSRCCNQPAKSETSKTNSTSNVPPAVLAEASTAPVAAAVSQPQQSYGTAPEIVAAITAAVSVCLDLPANQFQITSVQPVRSTQNSSEWAIAGRKKLMEKRQDLAMFRRERR